MPFPFFPFDPFAIAFCVIVDDAAGDPVMSELVGPGHDGTEAPCNSKIGKLPTRIQGC